jgi:hypothetical protein
MTLLHGTPFLSSFLPVAWLLHAKHFILPEAIPPTAGLDFNVRGCYRFCYSSPCLDERPSGLWCVKPLGSLSFAWLFSFFMCITHAYARKCVWLWVFVDFLRVRVFHSFNVFCWQKRERACVKKVLKRQLHLTDDPINSLNRLIHWKFQFGNILRKIDTHKARGQASAITSDFGSEQ